MIPPNGKYKLIELNPRIWGWHTLAIAAGVDLPYLLYQDMIGAKVDLPSNTNDVKWIRLATDIPTVFTEILKGKYNAKNASSFLHPIALGKIAKV